MNRARLAALAVGGALLVLGLTCGALLRDAPGASGTRPGATASAATARPGLAPATAPARVQAGSPTPTQEPAGRLRLDAAEQRGDVSTPRAALVTLRVVQRGDEAPLSAQVETFSATGESSIPLGTCDRDGRLAVVAGGSYRVRLPGFASAVVIAPRPDEVVRLGPAQSLRVTVRTPDGDPLPRCRVQAEAPEGVWEATTGLLGEVVFADAPADAVVHLRVARSDHVPASRTLRASRAPVRDVAIALSRGATLRGRVVDAAGRPRANATVYAYSDRSLDVPRVALTDARGEFVLRGLEPGRKAAVWARAGDAASPLELDWLSLGTTRTLTVRPLAQLTLTHVPSGRVELVPVEAQVDGLSLRRWCVSERDDVVRLGRLPAGLYRIERDGAPLGAPIQLDPGARARLDLRDGVVRGGPATGASTHLP